MTEENRPLALNGKEASPRLEWMVQSLTAQVDDAVEAIVLRLEQPPRQRWLERLVNGS
jgi:hypothetical protein